MTEVCHNVGIEPNLQPLSGEHLQQRSANCDDGAWLDNVADNFWGDGRHAFFDVRVVYQSKSVLKPATDLENKRRGTAMMKERSRTFSPFVFSTMGGVAPAASVVYRRHCIQWCIFNGASQTRGTNRIQSPPAGSDVDCPLPS